MNTAVVFASWERTRIRFPKAVFGALLCHHGVETAKGLTFSVMFHHATSRSVLPRSYTEWLACVPTWLPPKATE
jgi:hypothetical protein